MTPKMPLVMKGSPVQVRASALKSPTPKSGKIRSVPMAPDVAKALNGCACAPSAPRRACRRRAGRRRRTPADPAVIPGDRDRLAANRWRVEGHVGERLDPGED